MKWYGWLSLLLFLAQAFFFIVSISDFSRFAGASVMMAEEDCRRQLEGVRLLDCYDAARRAGDSWNSSIYACWAGLIVCSGLTLFGIRKGRQNARA